MTSKNSPGGQHVHRKPLSDQEWPMQDGHPTLPPISAGESLSGHSGLGFTKSATDPVPQQSHHRLPSESKSVTSSMTKLIKKAPILSQPSPPPIPPKEPSTTPPPFPAEAKASSRLTKEALDTRRRSSSINHIGHSGSQYIQSGLVPEPRGRSSSAQPPSNRVPAPSPSNRVMSGAAAAAAAAAGSRPPSSSGSQSPTRDNERAGRLRKSWLPGGRSRSHSRDVSGAKSGSAWILGQHADYNTSFLASGEKVPELWNENGNILVHLHAKGTGTGPSFKVPSFTVTSSAVFNAFIDSELTSPASSGRSRLTGDSLSVEDATRRYASPPLADITDTGESRLFLPVSMADPGHLSPQDLERLISIRNMFAFLTGQPLVGTDTQPTLFKVLLQIAALLKEFEFSSADGSTFGDAVDMSFGFFMEQVSLADVRHSREKTLEALVLGERMRSMALFNEAFAHAVGKYSAIRDLKSPIWDLVSPVTQERLERAHLDLVNRQHAVNNRLEAFEFPALFSGVANSSQYKDVKSAIWRRAFGRMRQFVLGYYKNSFGSWPPKARNKKNPFTESGLNRLVLKILYSDLCSLYDLTVDRESITTRVIDQNAEDIEDDGQSQVAVLRKILGEFDTSSPPVLPPIPFDLPKLPDMASVQENFHELPAKEQARLDKGLQEYQLLLILNKAYDFESFKLQTPFLEQFKEFEHKEAKGKPVGEIADQRIGYWLFLYVVIQSLPMLVVDAPNLQFTEGVEYFLCQPFKGSPPWVSDGPSVRKRWYEVPGGGGLVELSADAVEYSIEGTYQRSHCWLAAKQWEMEGAGALPPPPDAALTPLQPPQSVFMDNDPGSPARSESPPSGPPGVALRPRTGSPASRQSHAYRKSIVLGLEPVAMPMDGSNMPGSRLSSAHIPSPVQRPLSSVNMDRSRSAGNLQALATDFQAPPPPGSGRHGERQASVGGSTFDDILKDMEGSKKKKKKGFF